MKKISVALVTTQDDEPVLSLGYLVSWYRSYSKHSDRVSFSVVEVGRVFNRNVESARKIASRLSRFDVVGISTMTQDFNLVKEICSRLRKKNQQAKIVLGGYHVSSLPESMPRTADVAVIGEGETTFQELLDSLIENGSCESDHLARIEGIAYYDGEKLVQTQKREMIRDLEIIPSPAYDIFDKIHWLPVISAGFQVRGRVLTARGCPYNCVFCNSARFWGNTIRYFSAKRVVSEVKILRDKYHCSHITITDDLFTLNKKRMLHILELLREEGLLGKVTFDVQARANLFSQDICNILRQMNVTMVSFGIESGSAEVLKYLKGTTVTVDQNRRSVEMALKNGFKVWPQLIVGAPMETKKDIQKTLEFTRIPGITNFQISFLTPLPGTDLWDYAKGKRLVSNDMDWRKLCIDFKEKEIDGRVFMGEKLDIHQVWRIVKNDFFRDEVRKLSGVRILSPREIAVLVKYFFARPKRYFLLSILILENKAKKVVAKLRRTRSLDFVKGSVNQ